MTASALVLFSGGQDSTVCLAWALDRYARVETVGFDYGQRHAVELQARQAVRGKLVAAFPRWAKRLVPWSPEPWRLHGEALLSQGDLDGARRDFQSALRKDSSDWDSWVDLALVTRGGAQRRAVEQAHRLNPLEPIHLGGG